MCCLSHPLLGCSPAKHAGPICCQLVQEACTDMAYRDCTRTSCLFVCPLQVQPWDMNANLPSPCQPSKLLPDTLSMQTRCSAAVRGTYVKATILGYSQATPPGHSECPKNLRVQIIF